jgi:hypothetical protein
MKLNKKVVGLALSAAVISGSFVVPAAPVRAQTAPTQIQVGYGQTDATWHVGAGAGQYANKEGRDQGELVTGGKVDPHGHSTLLDDSYGVQSRLSFRAIVVDDGEDQTAFVKSDNYLAMDALLRRVGQILLLAGSDIGTDEIFHMASHNHFSPMYSTPSWGVWLFQDVFDIRAFEYQARQMAAAIREAELSKVDAKMGATTVQHDLFKGMVARRDIAEDGTPVGYPLDFGDFGLSVVRFDTLDDQPIATMINWGMHPEGLESDNLITAEFLAPLERFVERATGGGVVFGQGDVGSAESGPAKPEKFPDGIFRQWDNAGHAQVERGAWLLAQDVIKAWNLIGSGNAIVPFTSSFDVEAGNAWVPGPYSHPYPSVSNCRTENSVKGDTGIPVTGLPDCDRGDGDVPVPEHPLGSEAGMIWDLFQAEGVPVPAHYDAPGFTGVEENLRIHLQAFQLGEVIFLSCACEAQVDLILNLESRVDEEQENQWYGYDWTERLDCTQADTDGDGEPNADADWTCERKADDPAAPTATFAQPLHFSDAAYDRMHAQIYNDAGDDGDGRGAWDDPQNAAAAGTDPDDVSKIWGNFTHDELPAEFGYKLPIGVGHAGDYNGYTVSYREYMAYDHYRKALTSYGPHTADYMNSRLMELAGEMNGMPDELDPVEEADEARALADEARQVAWTTALGVASAASYEAWINALPNDSGVPVALDQPDDIKRFNGASFTWRGGSNAVDNPTVVVERKVGDEWVKFADQSGEIQTRLELPEGYEAIPNTYSGQQEWIWTANFEAFNAFPAEIGSTPAGTYRFVVSGQSRQGTPSATVDYSFPSDPFQVDPWSGVEVQDFQIDSGGRPSFRAVSDYPDTYSSVFPEYVKQHIRKEADRGEIRQNEIRSWCDTCSFRPWATEGVVESAIVTIERGTGATLRVPAELGSDGRWSLQTPLVPGDRAYVAPGDVVDNYGETNAVGTDRIELPVPPQGNPHGLAMPVF